MNLIVDNGGTKAIWTIAQSNNIIEEFTTSGIYPFHSDDETFQSYLEVAKAQISQPISRIYFYSTGCSLQEQKVRLNHIFKRTFLDSEDVEVATDLLGAARAMCGRGPGIACIMGTGSNSCLYDGNTILSNRGGLGYILGDEGSGALIGLNLIKKFLHKSLPKMMLEELAEEYKVDRNTLLNKVYQEPYANKYLASFAPFAHKYRSYPGIKSMLDHQFNTFFLKYILTYRNHTEFPVHFLGSIAYFFSEELERVAGSFGLCVKSFSVNPMPGLVAFHAGR